MMPRGAQAMKGMLVIISPPLNSLLYEKIPISCGPAAFGYVLPGAYVKRDFPLPVAAGFERD